MTRVAPRLRTLLAISMLACMPSAWASPALDELFDQAMERWSLPGMAVAVVEDGDVTWMRTAGELRVVSVSGGAETLIVSRFLDPIAAGQQESCG